MFEEHSELFFIACSSIVFFLILWMLYLQYEEVKLKKRLKITRGSWDNVERALSTASNKRWGLNTEKLNRRINQAGSPFNLTPMKFWIAKIALAAAAPIYASYTDQEPKVAIVSSAIAFFLPEVLLVSKRRDRVNSFKQELPEVMDTIELGVTADVPLNEVFMLAADTVEGNELKKELLRFSASYLFSRDREKSLKAFTEATGLPETRILAMALLQGEKTGRSGDIITSISGGMFNTTLSKVNRDEKSVEYKVLFALFVLMASTVMIYLQPYFSNLEAGLQGIF